MKFDRGQSMKKIRVHWIGGKHPIYEDFTKYPPSDIVYLSNSKPDEFNSLKVYQNRGYKLKKLVATKIFHLLKLPRIFYSVKNCDLIHSCSGFLVLNKKSWVIDVEHVTSFVGMQPENSKLLRDKRYTKKIEKILSSRYCKKIMPHSIASKKSILNALNAESFKEKIEVVYPAISPHSNKKKSDKDTITILYISNSFFDKGGKELLRAFDILNKRYEIRLIMKTKAPEYYRKKYSGFENVIFTSDIVTRKELFEKFYISSDIFVLPTYIDTFGYAFLEAMSVGLPLVGTNIFAVPEIIDDGKNGFLIDSPVSWFGEDFLWKKIPPDTVSSEFPTIVDQLVDKISILIEDTSLREEMSKASFENVKNGKFSVSVRNAKLKRIYDEALQY